jgi:hypothetical protein
MIEPECKEPLSKILDFLDSQVVRFIHKYRGFLLN